MTDNELNELVAEKVMGCDTISPYRRDNRAACHCSGLPHGMDTDGHIPDYANDIAAAWQVWERVKEIGYSWWMTDTSNGMIQVHIRREPTADTFVDVQSESLPRAICLAALEAVGVEVEG